MITENEVQNETQLFFVKVYGWMSVALIVTGFIAFWTSATPQLIDLVLGNNYIFALLILAEFILVAFLASWIMRMTPLTAGVVFILYSILNGLTISVIFLVFTTDSIASTFFITAGTFAIMSLYGFFTKSDLSKLGNLLFMGLIGLIIASAINLIFRNEMLDWITTFVGILVFVGLTAYDTQKIKKLNIIGNEGTDEDKKEAIIGALTLYLDFINLFLKLLRLFGKRK